MMAISFSMRVVVPPETMINVIGGESVILNIKTERYFGLDEVGTDMWAALAKGESVQSAYESLLSEYEVDAELLRNDLMALVEKLVAAGLIEVHE
jgi:ornithine carbamoyltransferase